MANGKIRIAVIGAGSTGTPLLRMLLGYSFIEVTMVADVNHDAPGMALAREFEITTTLDYTRVLDTNADIIVEVSGDPAVKPTLRQQLQRSGNNTTIIMPEACAILMMSMAKDELVQSLHTTQSY